MQIQLDLDRIKTMIQLWKDSVELRTPMADEFKFHFMSQRMTILNNFEQISSAWLMMIGAMSSPDNPNTVNAIRLEVKAFNEWAVQQIAVQTQLRADLETTD